MIDLKPQEGHVTVHSHRILAMEFDPDDDMLHIRINEKIHGKSHNHHPAPVEFDLSTEVISWLLNPKKRDALIHMLSRAQREITARGFT